MTDASDAFFKNILNEMTGANDGKRVEAIRRAQVENFRNQTAAQIVAAMVGGMYVDPNGTLESPTVAAGIAIRYADALCLALATAPIPEV